MQISSSDNGTLGTETTLKVNPSSKGIRHQVQSYECAQRIVTNQHHGACSLPSEHLSNEKGLSMRFRAMKGDAL